jgi:chemotaxis protein histidine kinase CheA
LIHVAGDGFVSESIFVERIAFIRARFVARLAEMIADTDAALVHMSGNEAEAVDAVDAAYRRFHDVVGISSTVGLKATGLAAQTIDAILTRPFRERRGLSADELASLRDGLVSLRATATADTKSKDKFTECPH